MGYMVRRVRLVNIKSHVDTTVEFSKGINLIEGDVGSGKTTILQSIEAALFGYEITEMLRVGEGSGEVEVEFEPPLKVGWRIVRQRVRDGHAVRVRGGYVVQDGVRSELAASEIRSFFVKKLGLGDSPNIRSAPSLFRLAVYVRQEELKSILRGGAEVDELVRRATGVRLYSTARENAASILRPILQGQLEKLGERIRLLEANLENTGGVEEELGEVGERLSEVEEELGRVEAEYQASQAELRSIREAYIQLERAAERLGGELEGAEREVGELGSQLAGLEGEILEGEKRVLELAGPGFSPKELEGVERRGLERAIRELEERIEVLAQEKASFERTLQEVEEHYRRIDEIRGRMGEELDYDALKYEAEAVEGDLRVLYEEEAKTKERVSEYMEIEKTGRCPVCGSEISPEKFSEHLGELEGKLAELRRKIAAAEARRSELAALMEKARVQAELRREVESRELRVKELLKQIEYKDYDEEIGRAKLELDRSRRIQQLLELHERLERARREHERLSARLEEANKRLEEIKLRRTSLEAELLGAKPRLEGKEKEVEELRRRREELVGERARLESRAKSLEELLEQRRRSLAELEEAKKRRALFESLLTYVSKSLIPVLEQVEAERLRWARRELSARTKEYFALLMQDDDRTVVVGEDYAPRLHRRINGEWVEIPAPSGGERSAMALSFRLALSEVARLRQGVQADFIMLDEPTDGFSEEQLSKFQSLLERLEIPQIILVTHHRSLESLGSNIILVEYSENGSAVRRVL